MCGHTAHHSHVRHDACLQLNMKSGIRPHSEPMERTATISSRSIAANALARSRRVLLWPTWCPSDDVDALQLRLGRVLVVSAHDERIAQRGSFQVLAHLRDDVMHLQREVPARPGAPDQQACCMSGRQAASDIEGASACFTSCLEVAKVGLVSVQQQASLLYCSACTKLHGAAMCSAAVSAGTRLEGSRIRAVGLQPLLLDASASSSITAAGRPTVSLYHTSCDSVSSHWVSIIQQGRHNLIMQLRGHTLQEHVRACAVRYLWSQPLQEPR